MHDSTDAFPAYSALLKLTDSYGGVNEFEAKLRQARDMADNEKNLQAKGVRFTARGRRTYGRAHGAQDFVDAAQQAFEAANQGDMHTAEAAAVVARQYRQTFFNLFNHGFDPTKQRQ